MMFLGSEVKNRHNAVPPYIVAEISGNHGGNRDKAFELISEAKRVGANAVKVQCYDADALTLPTTFQIQGSNPWRGKNIYELYMEAATPYEWMGPLFEHAKNIGIPIFSSVYDDRGIQELVRVGCRAFKIASYEANDLPFIEKVKATGKPMVVSTGTLNDIEIERLVGALDEENSILLHCVSNYPCAFNKLGLMAMTNLMNDYNQPIGFSCHNDDFMSVVIASQLGAAMVEVHLCLEADVNMPDYEFSFVPKGLEFTINKLKELEQANQDKWVNDEDGNKYKRSLYATRDIRKGETFTKANIGSYRPNLGCDPYLLPNILGRKANQAITKHAPMKMEYVK